MQKRGNGRGRQGPSLPFTLSKAVGAHDDTSAGVVRNERTSKAFALKDRKAQRKAKRQEKGQRANTYATQRHRHEASSGVPTAAVKRKWTDQQSVQAEAQVRKRAKSKKSEPEPKPTAPHHKAGAKLASKHSRGTKKASKFDELLLGGSTSGKGQQSADAEAALQAKLAKQLGLKGKSATKKTDPADNLDEFLTGISAGDDKPASQQMVKVKPSLGPASKSPDDQLSPGSSDHDEAGLSEIEDSDLDLLEGDSSSSSSQDVADAESGDESEDDSDADAAGFPDWDDDSLSEEALAHRRNTPAAETSGKSGEASKQKYIPPAARAALAAAADKGNQVQRRVRGLLNRMSDSNLPGIVSDVLQLTEQEGERVVADAVTSELLQAAAEGPRASERFAAVVAAFVAGLTATADAAGIGANFVAAVALRLETGSQEGQSLTCSNLATVIAHLYSSGLLSHTTVYSFLDHLTSRFGEVDVSMMLTVLQCCGLQLRSDDAISMKDFVVAVHARAAKATAEQKLSPRASIMLGLVLDIKNNKRKDRATGPAAVLSPGVVTWLKQSHVGHVQLKGLTWQKLLTKDKKGLWWLPSIGDVDRLQPLKGGLAVAAAAAAGEGGPGGAELLKLAAAQRMSTDARRAAFCVIMGSEDYVDASDRLLRLPLKGESEREIVRVSVECCLQERSWNPYYAHLLQRIVAASKAHRVTLRYCLWDHFKLVEQTDMRRLVNLAQLTGQLIASFALQLSSLKVINFSEKGSARSNLLWRVAFRHLLTVCKDDDAVESVFGHVAGQEQLLEFPADLLRFLRHVVGPWLAEQQSAEGSKALQRLHLAEVALKTGS